MMLRVVLVVCLAVCVLSGPSPQEESVVHDCTKCAPKCVDVSQHCHPEDVLVKNECGCLVCPKVHGDLTLPHHDHCINSLDNHSDHDHDHTGHDAFCCGLGHSG